MLRSSTFPVMSWNSNMPGTKGRASYSFLAVCSFDVDKPFVAHRLKLARQLLHIFGAQVGGDLIDRGVFHGHGADDGGLLGREKELDQVIDIPCT